MDEPEKPMPIEEAIHCVRSSHEPPLKKEGRIWWRVAKALYQALLPHLDRSPVDDLSEEERYELYEATAPKKIEFKHCPVTNKRCYSSAKNAVTVSGRVNRALRSYLCPHCGTYHVTKG